MEKNKKKNLLLKIKKICNMKFSSLHTHKKKKKKKKKKKLSLNYYFKKISKMTYSTRYVNPRFTLEHRVFIGK